MPVIPSKSERVAFWKHAYAWSSFMHADQTAVMLLQLNPPVRSLLRQALTCALTVAYAAPFKQRTAVRLLENEVIPPDLRPIHDGLIEHRDKVIAHRDLDGPIAEWGFVSQLVVNADAQGVTIETLIPIVDNESAMDMRRLFSTLIARMSKEMAPFLNDYAVPLPPPGKYLLALDDSVDWLRKIDSDDDPIA